jgi:hypothetical protein
MQNKAPENIDLSTRILKKATCPSLSGKSKLTYEVGFSDKAGVQFRVTGNSAAGAFNPDWFSLRAIEAALDKAPKGEPVTAVNFMSLFRNMSCNTPFFIFAALKHEGLVVPSKTKKSCYDPWGLGGLPRRDAAVDRGEGAAADRCEAQEECRQEDRGRENSRRFKEEVEGSQLAPFRWSVRKRPCKPKTRNGFFER